MGNSSCEGPVGFGVVEEALNVTGSRGVSLLSSGLGCAGRRPVVGPLVAKDKPPRGACSEPGVLAASPSGSRAAQPPSALAEEPLRDISRMSPGPPDPNALTGSYWESLCFQQGNCHFQAAGSDQILDL